MEESILFEISKLERLVAREFTKEKKNVVLPTQTQLKIIKYIMEHRCADIYQKDLEKVLSLRRATVSGVLQTMEKNGIIKRVQNESDHRGKKIILSENSTNLLTSAKDKFLNIESVATKDISNEELNAFLNTIKKLQKNIINYEQDK